MPSSVRAATVAQVPVPQAHVSPLPRSPHAHLQVGGIHHLHKLGVDALREVFVVLKARADLLQLQAVHLRYNGHAVGLPTLMQVTRHRFSST